MNSTTSRSVPCPAGTYGFSAGLATSSCSDLCPVGHYCPEGSISPLACPPGDFFFSLTSFVLGVFGAHRGLKDLNCHPNCSLGVCSEENRGESLCREGFYCPSGSTSPFQQECGGIGAICLIPTSYFFSDVFCPPGSALPVSVSKGYASVSNTGSPNQQISQRICAL
jgi:hypothetical protein